ncbi:MAG TPA: alpha-ketoacid dehydrogenase subunit beta [bacterium]|nr:alpha-ketoacid dehydrogenase subunit beta [bacterium]HQI48219.1 alpha-ketoacid dehydrogenase subunit beta [bacterium]HQJ64791.1 alpha-ketoacid dehydrogenase subunit beta [bacterium]
MAEITYLQAITDALREEMQRDPRVFLLGEDIGIYGGAFKVTKGLIDTFGEERVMDTPISEAAIIGVAVGAALAGMRPIAEMQFADFITSGFSQLVTNAATLHYRYGTAVPMVVRAPSGGGIHGGAFHSKNPEAWFVHQPGLKVVAPATAYDAKGLLKSAVRDDNPVLYFENKFLYRRIKEEIDPATEVLVPLGEARTVRQGSAAVIITYGAMLHAALEAADGLAAEGIEVTILDLRSLQPLDIEAILESVRRTNRVVIVHEANLTGGIGGEIAALISEYAFEELDAPIKRVAGLDTPTPYAPVMEEYWRPNAAKIARAVHDVVRF